LLLEFSQESAIFGAAVAVAAASASQTPAPPLSASTSLMTPPQSQAERVSNASTLVSIHGEEENKAAVSHSHSEGADAAAAKKITEQLLYQEAVPAEDAKDPQPILKSKQSLWDRFSRFFRRIFARFAGKATK